MISLLNILELLEKLIEEHSQLTLFPIEKISCSMAITIQALKNMPINNSKRLSKLRIGRLTLVHSEQLRESSQPSIRIPQLQVIQDLALIQLSQVSKRRSLRVQRLEEDQAT